MLPHLILLYKIALLGILLTETVTERRNTLPIFNGQLDSTSLLRHLYWPVVDTTYPSTVAWLGNVVAHHGQSVLSPQDLYSRTTNASNGANSPRVGNISTHGAMPSVVNAHTNSSIDMAQRFASTARRRVGAHSRDAHRGATPQQPPTYPQQTFAIDLFPTEFIRSGQGGETSASLRLPASSYRRNGRSSGGIRMHTSARYLPRLPRDINTAPSLQSRHIRFE